MKRSVGMAVLVCLTLADGSSFAQSRSACQSECARHAILCEDGYYCNHQTGHDRCQKGLKKCVEKCSAPGVKRVDFNEFCRLGGFFDAK